MGKDKQIKDLKDDLEKKKTALSEKTESLASETSMLDDANKKLKYLLDEQEFGRCPVKTCNHQLLNRDRSIGLFVKCKTRGKGGKIRLCVFCHICKKTLQTRKEAEPKNFANYPCIVCNKKNGSGVLGGFKYKNLDTDLLSDNKSEDYVFTYLTAKI